MKTESWSDANAAMKEGDPWWLKAVIKAETSHFEEVI